MKSSATLFERIIAKAHHQISGDDIAGYNTDFSGLMIPRNPDLKAQFREVATSLMSLLSRQKVNVLVMFYNDVAFCIRFHANVPLSKVNVRMVAESLEELPKSSGEPRFIIGSNESTAGNWIEVATDDEERQAEIFPLIDFDGVCFYYARVRAAGAGLRWSSSSAVESRRGSQTQRTLLDSSSISNPLTQSPFSERTSSVE